MTPTCVYCGKEVEESWAFDLVNGGRILVHSDDGEAHCDGGEADTIASCSALCYTDDMTPDEVTPC